jgi:hypothetical protein
MVSSRGPKSSRRIKTFVVTLLCLGGAAAGAYFLYLDFDRSGARGQGAPMAKVERREAKVRRKPSKSFAWSNARQEEALYRKDSLQTGVGSAASVRFNDGTLLELGENSLVVIDNLDSLSLNFFKGAVVLHTTDGDKRVTVGSDGKAKLEELPARLIKPEPLARYFAASGTTQPVRFAWSIRQAAKLADQPGLALQVSPERSFKGARVRTVPVGRSADASAGHPELEVALPEGAYYWRLVAGDKPLSETGQFRVVSARPLEPASPAGGERLTTFDAATTARFTWQEPDDRGLDTQASHELVVSRDPQFGSMVARVSVSPASGLASVPGLSEGTYYWRIQSRYGDLSVVSRVESFAVARARRPTLEQSSPEDRKSLEKLPSVTLSWRSDVSGLEYGIELKDAQGLYVAGTPAHTRAASYLFKEPVAGAYRWRVVAYAKAGTAIAETPWRGFAVYEGAKIALVSPAPGQELYTWDKPAPFEFEWRADELLARQPGYAYQVAVSRDPRFADAQRAILSPQTRETALASAKLSLDGGEYYWKVLVVDASGQVIKSSDAREFAYGLYPPLAPPQALSPAPKAVFDAVADDKPPIATWSEVPGAEGYEITLYKVGPGSARSPASPDGAPAGAQVVSRFETDRAQAELKNLPAADYAWSVRAIDRIQRRGRPMVPRAFSVTYGEPLDAPRVISPEVQ